MSNTVEAFRNSWSYLRGMTKSFIECVPEDKWDFAASDRHSAMRKQFRHMVWVSGLYNHAIKTGTMDFSIKKKTYSGSMIRKDILDGLNEKDEELFQILESLEGKEESYKINAFGSEMSLDEYLHILIQHESLHHGMWSLYANLGGFDVPKSWRDDWEL